MLVLTEAATRAALPFGPLIEALRTMFAQGCTMPVRHHHEVAVPDEDAATLLLMPAWRAGAYIGVKMVSVFPGNTTRGLPAIFGSYLLSSGRTGELLAILDGAELTARRTAATSALAADYLAAPTAAHLLMTGTGRLSLNLIEAHCSVRPIRQVTIWGRSRQKAEATAAALCLPGVAITVATDLEAAAGHADIVSCATLSSAPLIRGDWLKPGAHLDLVGAFKPTMRETDDRAIERASLFVDTRDGALSEGGDLVQPLRAGLITADAIRADLADMTRKIHPGRTSPSEITLFKSVGAALEDLAGAILAFEGIEGSRPVTGS